MYYYRKARPDEVNPQERRLANVTVERCSSALSIRQPELRFMVESYAGEIVYQTSIVGLARGRDIYVLTGLAPIELVRAVVHECRHVYQRDTGKQCYNRERDARLFELEFTLNFRGSTYDEIHCSLAALKPAVPKPAQRQVQPAKQRLVYGMPYAQWIRWAENLIQRLPATATSQRGSLAQEISRLKREMAEV